MCCLVTIAMLLGPRLAAVIWWLLDTGRWAATFSSALWPIIGILFLPWTTLAYVIVSPGGVTGIDWLLIIIGLIFDLGLYSEGRHNRHWLARR